VDAETPSRGLALDTTSHDDAAPRPADQKRSRRPSLRHVGTRTAPIAGSKGGAIPSRAAYAEPLDAFDESSTGRGGDEAEGRLRLRVP
jgi:hypothetical protein